MSYNQQNANAAICDRLDRIDELLEECRRLAEDNEIEFEFDRRVVVQFASSDVQWNSSSDWNES